MTNDRLFEVHLAMAQILITLGGIAVAVVSIANIGWDICTTSFVTILIGLGTYILVVCWKDAFKKTEI